MKPSITIRVSALLIALVLVLSLCACGNSSASSAAASESAASETAVTASAAEIPTEVTEASTAEEAAAPEADHSECELPLTDEPTTFSLYYSQPGFFNQYLDDPSDNECVKYLAEITGVSLDFYVVPAETESEQFLIMSAAGNLPDLVMNGSELYSGGGAKAIQDDVVVDLMDYQDVMPHYFSFVNGSSEWNAIFTVNDGESVDGVYQINYPDAKAGYGLMIRSDWLDELGLDMPKTYDEYYNVLTAFKNDKDCTAPLLLDPNADNQQWAYGYGCDASISDHVDLIQQFGTIDGEVVYWPTSDNYRSMLEMLASWYQEGLIDADFYTKTSSNIADEELISGGGTGVWYTSMTNLPAYYEMFEDESSLAPSYLPTQNGSYENAYHSSVTLRDHTCLNITTNCPDPELAAKFLDFFYSDEGSLLATYGVEGYTFEYNDAGEPAFTDLIANSDTGFGAELVFVLYGMGSFPSVKSPTVFYSDRELAAKEIWSEISSEDSIYAGISQAVRLTAEEEEDVTAIMGDIVTVVRETTFRIICGESDISVFDDMVEQAESMGIADAIAVYQEKYDAYNA